MPPELSDAPPELTRTEGAAARPWGPWATIGLSIVILIAALAAQTVVAAVIAIIWTARGQKIDVETFSSNGIVLALAAFASGLVAFALSVFFAYVRRGIDLKSYLALRLPPLKECFRWFGFLLLFVLVSDGITWLLGKPIVPDFLVDTYQSAGWALPFLWLALFVTAPLSEEFFFRGFLFAGLHQTRLRGVGTAIITAALWAGIHVQYDFHGMLVIFFLGLCLAFVRLKTASLWLCVILHAGMNLIATIQLLVYLSL